MTARGSRAVSAMPTFHGSKNASTEIISIGCRFILRGASDVVVDRFRLRA
jgi:hypothetical protein